MIQRIQTVYLAIVSILLLVPIGFHFTLASLNAESGLYQLTATELSFVSAESIETISGTFPIAAAFVLSLVVTIFIILQYKNRKLQMRLIQLAMLLLLVIGGLIFYYAGNMGQLSDAASVSYSPILAVLPVDLILYFLAYRGIKQDDELVRSADRLR